MPPTSILANCNSKQFKQLASARSERDKTFYENQCASLNRQSDNLVYELHDLTPEEIPIVEGCG